MSKNSRGQKTLWTILQLTIASKHRKICKTKKKDRFEKPDD